MPNPTILEINVQTGEETIREMTDAELAERLKNDIRVDEQGEPINSDSVV
jgi:hypothetical protein